MHKKYIVTLLFLIVLLINTNGQSRNNQKSWAITHVELSGTYDIFNRSVGFMTKGKKEVFSSNHFNGFAGLAFQYSYQNETDKFLEQGLNGFNSDIGFYTVFDVEYYPFKHKKFFIGLEPFLGVTTLKSKGKLKIPEYDVSETYANNYTYINYGVTPKFGYNIGRFRSNIFIMIPLKGLLDSGRNRFGGMDSRLLLGASISYTIKP